VDKFKKSLPMMLHRTLDVIIPHYRKVFKEHNISEQQWRVLRVLWEKDECTSAELANITLLPNPSLVGIVDRMMKKDLLTKKRNDRDRRIVNVSLTSKGKELESVLMPKIEAVYQQIMNQCDTDSWHTMIDTLQTIIDAQNTI